MDPASPARRAGRRRGSGTPVPASPAAAQLDPGNFDIRQYGTVVGHIFVPVRLSPAVYVEHWVVSREYVYPSSHAPVVTEIVPSNRSFASEQEFFRQLDFGPGSRYIRVLAQESGTLPKAGRVQARADHAGLLGVGQVPFWAVAATAGLAWRLTVRSSTSNRRTPQRRPEHRTPKPIGHASVGRRFRPLPRRRNEHLLTAYRPPEHSAPRECDQPPTR